ncbi:CapA family protein [Butyricimonas hominis]|jgi:capsule synthesis protein, capA|uniref:CapA family protein n=1 Tax=Butyricimonas hominis TaxID=2763032 RepID=A0ABR7D3L3_9BACT|nr:CapA family protein [Butyricimonas hominis]MBC5622414.1 CapA family protein [Butyricimonas hominis]
MNSGSDLRIAFLGDIMPGGVISGKDEFIDENVLQYLNGFDLRIATLECAIGDDYEYDRVKMQGRMNIIYAKDVDLRKIEILNINIVTLANNHIFDLGLDGFQHICKLLDKRKILRCGAGMTSEEAAKPVIVEEKGKRVCFFSYCQYNTPYVGYVPVATKNSAGVNPLDINKVIVDITEAKKEFDYVFVIPHWGVEYISCPTVECKKLAYKMIEAGADGVIGGHPHRVQSCLQYRGKPIFFSLGNFLFADFFMAPPRPIWYPCENDVEMGQIKITNDYPFPVKEPLKRIWRNFSRIGMIAEISIGSRLKVSWNTVRLAESNRLSFYPRPLKFKIKLYLIELFIQMPWYDGGKFVMNVRELLSKKSYMNRLRRYWRGNN